MARMWHMHMGGSAAGAVRQHNACAISVVGLSLRQGHESLSLTTISTDAVVCDRGPLAFMQHRPASCMFVRLPELTQASARLSAAHPHQDLKLAG